MVPLGPAVRAQGPVVTFETIGDLPLGYTFSTVRDATKVGNVIYAVGGSASRNQFLCGPGQTPQNSGCAPNLNTLGADTPVLWTRDNITSPVLTALPNLVTNALSNQTGMAAQAITRDAAYIASIAHDQPTGPSRVATRVTTNGLATLNLTAAPYTVFASPSSAAAISDDGSILYGVVPSGANRAARFDTTTNTTTLLPLPPNTTTSTIGNRATSSDGSIAVGTASGTGGAFAFRYQHGTGVTVIPRLPGGTFNRALAVTPNGNITLVSGNTTSLPNGGLYLYDTTVPASPVITKLGSPMTAWAPGAGGAGITADGSVVIVTFLPLTSTPSQFDGRNTFFHNVHGWFHLESALAKGGLDVLNLPLEQLAVNGISPDGTLVYGQGRHDSQNGPIIEGFVAEFPAGFLANFDVPVTPPANSAIVGAWYAADTSASALADPTTANPTVVVFLADGSFFHIEANTPASEPGGANGFERGRYRWDSAPGSFSGAFSASILHDTNGDIGFSGLDGVSGFTADVVGDTLTISHPNCPDPDPQECSLTATRVTGGPAAPLAGAWIFGNPLVEDNSGLLVLLGNGDYYFAEDGNSEPAPVGDPNGLDGIEKGTWSWTASTGEFVSWTTVDTNGQWGLNSTFPLTSPPGNPNQILQLTLSPDGLRFTVQAGTESFSFLRVAVVATPTPIGTDVVVTPTSPTGSPVVTLEFSAITEAGETTLQTIDPTTAASAPALPSGFSLGNPPLYYEIDTTATFAGPVAVCFNYAGVTFTDGTPRLLHFDEDLQSWVDITTSVNSTTSTICGITSSFSPFAIAASQVVTSGFASPISPVGSYQNVVKGGSTVPLKFKVYVNGVEKTDTSGLVFSAVQVSCSGDAGETPVIFMTTGGTSLHYGGGQFVQNWKVPATPGCYLVRVTGDGLLLNAVFKVK